MSRWPPRMMPKLMALSIEAAPGTAVTKPPPASVRFTSSMPSGGRAPRPITPFSAWKNTPGIARQMVRDQARQADAEVDEHPRPDLPRHPSGDHLLRVDAGHAARSSRWSTSTPGVLTKSGGITPTGTIRSGSAITVSAASAMIGLKLCAVSEYWRLPR